MEGANDSHHVRRAGTRPCGQVNAVMDTNTNKTEILEAAIRQHETVIEDFREGIRQSLQNEGKINEEAYDPQTQAFNAEASEEVDHLSRQLEFANRELEELRRMRLESTKVHDTVQLGSVVKTDRETFFVSASIERFFVDSTPYFGLSLHSPLYQVMKGKKAGDTFAYGKTNYTITELF